MCIDQLGTAKLCIGDQLNFATNHAAPHLCYCLQTAGATILCSAHYGFHLFSANVEEISHLHLDFNLCLIYLMGIGKNMKFLKINQLDLQRILDNGLFCCL